MGELEDILGNVVTVSELSSRARLLDSETLNLWHKRLDAINAALPDRALGDKILKSINEYSSLLTKDETVQIIEFAYLRLRLHTDKEAYKKDYQGIDDNLGELPKIMCDLKQSSEDPSLPCLFFEYCRHESPHTTVEHLPYCYDRFVKVKKWYERVPEEFKILPVMRDDPQMGNGKWDNLRKMLKDDNPKDREYAGWIKQFEDVEKQYNFSFTNVIDFIGKHRPKDKEQQA